MLQIVVVVVAAAAAAVLVVEIMYVFPPLSVKLNNVKLICSAANFDF